VEEKRTAQRVELQFDFKNSIDRVIAVKNVSENGICILTDELYESGRYFSRNFILPGGAGINILGKVMWQKMKKHNQYETGIQFISLGSTDREHLMHYLNKTLKKKKKSSRE
jgi:hypothetical protein